MNTVIAVVPAANTVAGGQIALLAALLAWGLVRQRGTTLWAPCIWALISTTMLALDALGQSTGESIGNSVRHFAAVASTFCPMMAVLGAKRPQNRGWQWVVLTLWLVLIWPAGQAWLLANGRHIELFVAWRIFLVGLVAIGLLNYLPTRNWPAATLTAAGQLCLLQPYLWNRQLVPTEWSLAAGVGCFVSAAGIVLLTMPSGPQSRGVTTPRLDVFDKRWQRFRDAYGVLWALRIQGRINQTAEVHDWPIRLAWSGFAFADRDAHASLSTSEIAQLEQTMDTLMRRFEKL